MTTFLSPAARTASGTFQIPTEVGENVVAGIFLLGVTAAAVGVGDTLDVYLQHTVDGSTWDDFIHFTQALGNGGAVQFYARWNALGAAPESELSAPQDAGMAAGVLQQPVGNIWRVKWVIGGGTASFTFSVTGNLVKLS